MGIGRIVARLFGRKPSKEELAAISLSEQQRTRRELSQLSKKRLQVHFLKTGLKRVGGAQPPKPGPFG